MSDSVRIYALTADGSAPLPVPASAEDVNQAFDSLPLGIYEGLRTYDGTRLLGLAEHYDRAERSVRRLAWDFELDRQALSNAIVRALHAWEHSDARLRFDVLSEPIEVAGAAARVVFGLSPFEPLPREAYSEGVGVATLTELTRSQPLIKQASFVAERRAYPLGGPDTFERVMVTRDQRILECTSSNFFVVRDGSLLTARGDVLEGITATFVEQLASALGIPTSGEMVLATELESVHEAFLTSSVKGIVPVVRIDGAAVASGSPGPLTRRLVEAYESFADERACEPLAR